MAVQTVDKDKSNVFISIEGLEGSGKSSVIEFLKKQLDNHNYIVYFFREPGSTEIGEKIRQILLDRKNKNMSPYTELLLYLAARSQLIEEKLLPILKNEKNCVVICDRFIDSTIAYQGYGLQLGDIVKKASEMFSLGILPDITLVLNLEPEKALSRLREFDRIESRPLAFHKRIYQGYLELAQQFPQRVQLVDADCNLDELQLRSWRIVENFLNKQKIAKKNNG